MDALFFLPTKSWKNHPQKLLRVTQIHFFSLLPGLPKQPKQKKCVVSLEYAACFPSFIYSCSIGHILEHEFFCLGRLGSSGSKEKKWIWVFLSNFWWWFFQLFVSKKNLKFFWPQKVEKTTLKVAQKNSNPLFFLTAWAAQTAQTEEFMLQNLSYRTTVYRTGDLNKRQISQKIFRIRENML